MAPHTRPRPSSIDQLPDACEGIVAWAAQELARSGRTQTEIYAEFSEKLDALKSELSLDFEIPHFSSFNRHAIRLAGLGKRLQRSRAIADAIVDRTDGDSADNVTKAATLTLKTLILEMLENGGEDGFSPKEALAMAGAMRSVQIAENLSTTRRQKLDTEFKANAEKIIDKFAKEGGLSADTIAQLRSDFLGIRPKPEA